MSERDDDPQAVEHPQDGAPTGPSPEEFRARRGRNVALAIGLVVFAVLVFLVTVVRLGANVLDRPL
ncbi:hypothetical protein [Phenylobacterium sp.]|uniref:hypothetical protein n=1 Tax=Phenylobacterium sp. TaxID=1871053 RepID=UPI0008C28396|nr:hypothetical protein [Phenylobacterium sp.]OHB33734.1 MAG: hypothetical protein A2882_05445 [Phenylobacterium sp. RIFCSPHIGHO2_01_FULL_70_10]